MRATGNPVPREDHPRQMIGAEPVEVPNTSYYRRRLNRGELELVEFKGVTE